MIVKLPILPKNERKAIVNAHELTTHNDAFCFAFLASYIFYGNGMVLECVCVRDAVLEKNRNQQYSIAPKFEKPEKLR